MQKLDRRNTYTPPNAAPVRCNCDPSLKVPRGKDGVASLKTLSNNSEEHLRTWARLVCSILAGVKLPTQLIGVI